jgi:hypothetical protein
LTGRRHRKKRGLRIIDLGDQELVVGLKSRWRGDLTKLIGDRPGSVGTVAERLRHGRSAELRRWGQPLAEGREPVEERRDFARVFSRRKWRCWLEVVAVCERAVPVDWLELPQPPESTNTTTKITIRNDNAN